MNLFQAIVGIAVLSTLHISPCVSDEPLDPEKWPALQEACQANELLLRSATGKLTLKLAHKLPHETEFTNVVTADATFWFDSPKYHITLTYEVYRYQAGCGFLESEDLRNDGQLVWNGKEYKPFVTGVQQGYVDTGCIQQEILWTGSETYWSRTMNGRRQVYQYHREFALPLLFAGMPCNDPVRLWRSTPFGKKRSSSEFSKIFSATAPDDGSFRVTRFRSHKVPDSPLYSDTDLEWAKSNDVFYIKRLRTIGSQSAISSMFPGDRFCLLEIDVLDFEANIPMEPIQFELESLNIDPNNIIHRPESGRF